ncbi:MAG: Minf_1886 family protein, partial [Gemmatimonadota bacterium]
MRTSRLDASTRDRLSEMDGRYDDRAYAFVLAALEQVVERLPQRRHVTGPELAEGCRELGLRLYGPLARTVLEHWHIRSTRDIGEIVFNLLEVGVLSK